MNLPNISTYFCTPTLTSNDWQRVKTTLQVISSIAVTALLILSASFTFYPQLATRAICVLSVCALKALCKNYIDPKISHKLNDKELV